MSFFAIAGSWDLMIGYVQSWCVRCFYPQVEASSG